MWVYQFSSVAQSCPTLCDPMDCSMPGLPVHHQLPEFTQTHVHWVSDAIQPSHPLSSPLPPTFNLSQHQGLFKWVSSSHQVAKVFGVSASTSVLPMNTQDWSPLGWTGWIPLGVCISILKSALVCFWISYELKDYFFKKEKKTGFHSWMKIPSYLFIREEKATVFFLPCYQRVLRILCWELGK